MVLYDGNYRFLGMSEKFLNRLGYDDINEFSSYHKDFADLFEKRSELIYNFENFSWLDFVLYGGANKDRAILKTKSGDLIDVKIKVEEIPLKDEFGGVEKLYNVKIVEKGEVKDSSTEKPKTQKKISLSSMLTDDKKPEEKKDDAPIKLKKDSKNKKEENTDDNLNINLSFIKDEDIKEDTKTTKPSFSLDFLKSDKPKEEETESTNEATPIPEISEKPQKDEVVLNFFNSTVNDDTSDAQENAPTEEESELNFLKEDEPKTKDKPTTSMDLNFLKKEDEKPQTPEVKIGKEPEAKEEAPSINLNFLKQDEPKTEEASTPNIDLNFLKKEDDKPQTPEVKIEKVSETKEEAPTINLNFLKQDEPKTEEAPTPNIELNFLKKEEDKPQTPDVKIEKEPETKEEAPTINLNFLKQDEPKTEEAPTPNIDLNFLKKEEDKPQTPDVKIEKEPETKEEAPTINLNFLKQDGPKTEEPQTPNIDLNFLKKEDDKPQTPEVKIEKEPETKEEAPTINLNFLKQEEVKKEEEKELSKEEKSEIIQQIKSDIEEIDTNKDLSKDNEEVTINDALKSILNINNVQEKKEESIVNRENKEVENKESKKEEVQEEEIDFLSNLDISKEDKKAILQDFINDTSYNLNLINNFLNEKDLDGIKYTAIKIKSSSEILSLKNISNTLSKVLETQDIESARVLIESVADQVKKLENKL